MAIKKHSKDYVCPLCFNQIENCTCIYPSFTLIMIDNQIQDAVRILNQKGYRTMDSCEGHIENMIPNTYISFYEPIKSAPVGFTNEGKVIRKIYSCDNKKTFNKEKKEAIENLNKWAENLEYKRGD